MNRFINKIRIHFVPTLFIYLFIFLVLSCFPLIVDLVRVWQCIYLFPFKHENVSFYETEKYASKKKHNLGSGKKNQPKKNHRKGGGICW